MDLRSRFSIGISYSLYLVRVNFSFLNYLDYPQFEMFLVVNRIVYSYYYNKYPVVQFYHIGLKDWILVHRYENSFFSEVYSYNSVCSEPLICSHNYQNIVIIFIQNLVVLLGINLFYDIIICNVCLVNDDLNFKYSFCYFYRVMFLGSSSNGVNYLDSTGVHVDYFCQIKVNYFLNFFLE